MGLQKRLCAPCFRRVVPGFRESTSTGSHHILAHCHLLSFVQASHFHFVWFIDPASIYPPSLDIHVAGWTVCKPVLLHSWLLCPSGPSGSKSLSPHPPYRHTLLSRERPWQLSPGLPVSETVAALCPGDPGLELPWLYGLYIPLDVERGAAAMGRVVTL